MLRKLHLVTMAVTAAAGLALAQATLTNEDVIKLAKSGLSEQFVIDLIEQQGSRLSSDVSSLIALKEGGVNERIINAVIRKTSSVRAEALNTDSVLRLVKAGFTDGFIIDLLNKRPGQFAASADRIIELKNAGVSERLLSLMVIQGGGGREIERGTEISVRLIDSIDSDINRPGEEFRASLEDPILLGDEVAVRKGADATVRLVAKEESGRIKGRSTLTLQLVSIMVDGKPVAVETGEVMQYSGSRAARTAKSAAVVGAIGAVIGGIAGGGKGAAIGAAAGAGAGAGAQIFLDPQRVKVPSESVLTFVTEKAIRIP